MMKKILMLTALVAITAACAKETQTTHHQKREGIAPLTEAQRKCVKNYGCPVFEKTECAKVNKESKRAIRACKRKAYEHCGLEMPTPQKDRNSPGFRETEDDCE